MPDDRERALALSENDIGQKRHQLYKSAFSHIKKAMENSYYLEAITLIESLIADRLESRLSYLLGKNFGFKNLGDLIKETKKTETDEALKDLVLKKLELWRKDRNTALHQMAKLDAREQTTWEERLKTLPKIAENGYKILREIDKISQNLRRKGQ